MTLTDPVEVTWQELQVDGAPLRAFGERFVATASLCCATAHSSGRPHRRSSTRLLSSSFASRSSASSALKWLTRKMRAATYVPDPGAGRSCRRAGTSSARPGRPSGQADPRAFGRANCRTCAAGCSLITPSSPLRRHTILSAVARLYARPADYLQRLRTGAEDVLRLLHYEARRARSLQAFPGHTDLSLITLFPSATSPGLEREVQPGIWQALDVPEDGLLIGTGGALGVLTDGDLRPLHHRVRQLSTSGVAKRYSVSMFVNPRPDIKVTLLRESSGGVGDEADQRAQTFEAWFQERVRQAQQQDGAC